MAVSASFAQAPDISYPTTQSYTLNQTITPVLPGQAGGPVPKTTFGQISVFAGSGVAGATDANGTAASFRAPHDIKLDAAGNLYVADAGNNLIRKISPNGDVITFAGSGVQGSADGLATLAGFNNPTGLVIDNSGNIFIADQKNHTIRKITPAGLVTTLAGLAGNSGLVNSQGSFARFNLPTGLSVDKNGGLYITDQGNNLVRYVAQDGNASTIAGNGKDTVFDGQGVNASFSEPKATVYGTDGLVYVTDFSHIRTIDNGNQVVTIAGGFFNTSVDGSGKGALFNDPRGIVRDGTGALFITDYAANDLRRMDVNGSVLTILKAPLNKPTGLAFDPSGILYIADEGNNVIRKMITTGYAIAPALPPGLVFDSTTGTISGTPTQKLQITNYTVIAYNTSGRSVFNFTLEVRDSQLIPQTLTFPPLADSRVGNPDIDPAATSSGPLPITYVSSDFAVAVIANGKIHLVGAGTATITAYQKGNIDYADASPYPQTINVAPPPDPPKPDVTAKAGPFTFPLDQFGNYVVTADQLANIKPDPTLPPLSITVRPSSTFTCADLGVQTITVGAGYGPDPADPLNAEFNEPSSLSFDASSGNLYISDQGDYSVREYGADTRVTTLAGGIFGDADGKGPNARFSRGLLSLANDAEGDTYVCDVFNSLIRKIAPDGVTTAFANSALKALNSGNPVTIESIAVDPNDNIFAADKTRIFKISKDGSTAIVFAGSLVAKNLDGIGTGAAFSGIIGLAFDKTGQLYVSTNDKNNGSSVRKITPQGVTTTVYTVPYASDFTRLVVDSKGNIFVASSEPLIYKITPAGELSVFAGGTEGFADGKGSAARFHNPQGIAIDGADNLYIADSDNHRIRMISPSGKVITIAGNGVSAPLDNTNVSNASKVSIKVNIVSELKFVSDQKDVIYRVSAKCPVTMPDYTLNAQAASTCANSIKITQQPQAGSPLVAGQTVKVTLTAQDNLGQTTDLSFNVNVVALPPPSVKVTLLSLALCDGATLTFKADTANVGKTPTYAWQVNGTTVPGNAITFTSSTLKTGDQLTCIVTNNDFCGQAASDPSDPFPISTEASINASVIISPSITDPICPGVGITFTAMPNNVQTAATAPVYQWKVNGNDRGTGPEFTSKTLVNGDVVTCDMTSNVKCAINPVAQSNPIIVRVKTDQECAIKIPNTFTPNGDGVNDYWEIPELNSFPECDFSVFNRYGKLVFHSKGYGKPWDGLYNGGKLGAGTYYFVIDLKTGAGPISGSVTIIR